MSDQHATFLDWLSNHICFNDDAKTLDGIRAVQERLAELEKQNTMLRKVVLLHEVGDAILAGAESALNGGTERDNPYKMGDPRWAHWLRGAVSVVGSPPEIEDE